MKESLWLAPSPQRPLPTHRRGPLTGGLHKGRNPSQTTFYLRTMAAAARPWPVDATASGSAPAHACGPATLLQVLPVPSIEPMAGWWSRRARPPAIHSTCVISWGPRGDQASGPSSDFKVSALLPARRATAGGVVVVMVASSIARVCKGDSGGPRQSDLRYSMRAARSGSESSVPNALPS